VAFAVVIDMICSERLFTRWGYALQADYAMVDLWMPVRTFQSAHSPLHLDASCLDSPSSPSLTWGA